MELTIVGAKINDFFIILFSILVEGIPFILIGAILSGVVEFWISEKKILEMLPKSKFLQFISMVFLGNLVPVCECGNVPFARRMVKKNLPAHLSITFLLAAPAFNPIVIFATLAAFSGDYKIVLYRLLFTSIIAIGAGYIFSFLPAKKILNKELEHPHEHNHEHEKPKTKLRGLLGIARKELLEMAGVFLLGATIATVIQTFVPKELVLGFNQQEWIAIIAMMVLAFVISICSNVDSFFALAYAQVFPTSSILAFLVLGPMIDIKAIPMLKTIFKWRTVGIMGAFVFLATFLLSYLYFILS